MFKFKKSVGCIVSAALTFSVLALSLGGTGYASSSKPAVQVTQLTAYESGAVYTTDTQLNSSPSELSAESPLPSYYSSKDEGYTTAVKNQEEKSICWAYATTSVFETVLNKNGDYTEAFSTSHLDNWATPLSDGSGWQRSFQNDGAVVAVPIGYLTSWQGPKTVSEFPDDSSYLPFEQLKTDELPDYGVTALMYLTNSDTDTVKSAIMEYGAVWASYSNLDMYWSVDETSYYCDSTDNLAGHAVTLIGWDDNYSRYKFTGYTSLPKSDGAWLVQNSWGEDACDNGYFWISYEDATMLTGIFDAYAIVDYVKVSDNMKLYQAETYGATLFFNFSEDTEVMCLNTFDFSQDDVLDKVIFEYEAPGNGYELYYIPIDSRTGSPSTNKNKWVLLGSGTVDYEGYICADIEDYDLPEGEGAIAVNLMTSDPDDYLLAPGICYNWRYNENKYLLKLPASDSDVSYVIDNNSCYTLDELIATDGAVFVIKALTYTETGDVKDNYNSGDANMDGEFNIKDATLLQKYIVGVRMLSEEQIALGDMDSNGTIDGNDVATIEKMLVNII